MKLKGKVAIITGAKQGIGRAIAKSFAKEGADLSLNYFEQGKGEILEFTKELQNEYGVKIISNEGDISKEDTARSLIENTIKELHKIDILINVAAIDNQSLVKDMEISNWERMIDVNLKSVFLTTKYTIPYMIKQNSGRIINFASQLGQKGEAGKSHYAASKAGIIGFTKSVALEVGQYGITANCIAPGPIETQMVSMYSDEERIQKEENLVIPRFGKVEEVVPTVIFLASEPDGNIYTGQTLGPNSGDVML